MENKVIRKTTLAIFVASIFVCCIVIWLPYMHPYFVQLKAEKVEYQTQKNAQTKMTSFELLKYNTIKAKKKEPLNITNKLRIPIPEGVSGKDVKISNDYIARQIEILLPKGTYDFLYQNPVIGTSDWISDFEVDMVSDGLKVTLTMDTIVEVESKDNGQYLYMEFASPKDKYDKIVIIDAGHGGTDPGCVVGKKMEKDINLEVVQELKLLFDQQTKIKVYYTRLDDPKPTYQQRADLANLTGAKLFLSIHQNSVPKASDSYIHGIEVLYDAGKQQLAMTSKEFARVCIERVSEASGALNRGIIERNDLFVLNQTEMPSVIVETGYLTNPNEHEKLITKEYQEKLAKGLYAAVMEALEMEEK